MAEDYPWSVWIDGLYIDQSGPVRNAYISLGTGLHVIYGLNGAGKTTVLRGLSRRSGLILSGARVQSVYRHAMRLDDWPEYFETFIRRSWLPHRWYDAPVDPDTTDERLDAVCAAFHATTTFALERTSLIPLIRYDEDPLVAEEATRTRAALQALQHAVDDQTFGEAAWDGSIIHDYFHDYNDNESLPFYDSRFPRLASLPEFTGSWTGRGEAVETEGWFANLVIDDTPVDPNEVTAAALIESWSYGDPEITPDYWAGPEIAARCAAIEAAVNDDYARLLLNAPRLTIVPHRSRDWFSSGLFSWRAVARNGAVVPLTSLSGAEQRWANLAVQIGLCRFQNHRVVLALDEPESGLHRSAEAHLARGIGELAQEQHSLVVLATHSPEFLDCPGATLHHVHTPAGQKAATVQQLDRAELQAWERFGLHPSDLIRRQRVFLLVEGQHDELILKTLLGRELADAQVQIIALRGGAQLAAVADSAFLFDYTEARIIALLDNLSAAQVRTAWDEAVTVAATEGLKPAFDHLKERLPRSKAENRFLGEFFAQLLKKGRDLDRVIPFGLQERDVVLYLPVQAFAPGKDDWAEVVAEYETSGTKLDLKTWMSQRYGSGFDNETLLRAIESMDAVPAEFTELLKTCRSWGLRPNG